MKLLLDIRVIDARPDEAVAILSPRLLFLSLSHRLRSQDTLPLRHLAPSLLLLLQLQSRNI